MGISLFDMYYENNQMFGFNLLTIGSTVEYNSLLGFNKTENGYEIDVFFFGIDIEV